MAINLLPLKQKRFAYSVYRTHRLIAILIVVDFLLAAMLVLFLALNITIGQEKNANTKTLISLSGKSQVVEFNALRDEVNLIAKYVAVAKSNTVANVLITDYFDQIITTKPSGIYLTSFDYLADSKGQIIKLGGVTGNRQNLRDFNFQLESLPWVEIVDSPVTNLVGDANSVFSLTLTLAKAKP